MGIERNLLEKSLVIWNSSCHQLKYWKKTCIKKKISWAKYVECMYVESEMFKRHFECAPSFDLNLF